MATTYEPIATTTLGTAAATISFTSISSAYTDLRLVFVGYSVSTDTYAQMRFNSDTGANYSSTGLRGNGTAASSYQITSGTFIYLNNGSNGLNRAGNNKASMLSVDIFSYTGSNYKNSLITTSNDDNGGGTVERSVGLWLNTAAITSITLLLDSGNFATGATATLYGILKA